MNFGMRMNAWMELNESFDELLRLNAKKFASKLKRVLYFLRFKNLITSGTFQAIVKDLHLNEDWEYLENNSDEHCTLYVGHEVTATFTFEDVIIYVMQCLLEDPLVKAANSNGDWPGFKKVMDSFVPDGWNDFYESIKCIDNPFFAPNLILWVEENEHGAYSLWQISHHFEVRKKVDMRSKTVVFEGVNPDGIAYIYETNRLYAKVQGLDAFLIYNPLKNEKEIFCQVYLYGVGQEVEYYGDEESVLHSYANHKVSRLDMVDTENTLNVNYDGKLTVSPPEHCLAEFVPYTIDANGVKNNCSCKYVREFLWERMIRKVCDKQDSDLEHHASDVVYLREMLNAPYPFSVGEIKKRLEELKQKGYCSKENLRITTAFLESLCEENGINQKEDITCLLYEELAQYLSEGVENKVCNESQEQGKIGYFSITKDGELLTDFDYLFTGIVKEKYIVKEKNYKRYEGEIYYDRSTRKYIMKYTNGFVPYFPYVEKLEEELGICGLVYEEEPETTEETCDDEMEYDFLDEDEKQLLEIDWTD